MFAYLRRNISEMRSLYSDIRHWAVWVKIRKDWIHLPLTNNAEKEEYSMSVIIIAYKSASISIIL